MNRVLLILASVLLSTSCATTQHNEFDRALVAADSLVQAAVDSEVIPGAVLLVGKDGEVIHQQAFGYASLYDYEGVRLASPESMKVDHVFDVASLTKVLATTFGMMLLVDQYGLDLDDPVSAYLPDFRGTHKDSVTTRHLLQHAAGLYPWKPIYIHARSGEGARAHIGTLELPYPVGRERHYSDLGFMMLGYIIEQVSGRPLDQFLDQELYAKLGLGSTMFAPSGKHAGPFAATSHGNPFEYKMVADDSFGYQCEEDPADFEDWRDYTVRGEVNDGNAFYGHGGVAGHAGLFSTAPELQVLMQLLLDKGHHRGQIVIQPATVEMFLSADAFGNGLGWIMSPDLLGIEDLPEGSFAHTGFTGTYALGIPEHNLSVILLTNRQNLGVDGTGRYKSVNPLRREVARTLISAL